MSQRNAREPSLHEMVSRARAAGVLHLSLALDPGDPLVLGDPDALEQLVTDLLVVAAHTVAGGSPLQVETRTEAGPPSRVVVAISSLGHAPDPSERHQRILDEHGGAIETRSSPAPLTLLLSFPAPPLSDLLGPPGLTRTGPNGGLAPAPCDPRC